MRTIPLYTALFLACLTAKGQSPIVQSHDAYWVIERNVGAPRHATVKIYDGDDKLIYEQKMERRVINIGRKKDQRMLDRFVRKYVSRMASAGKKFRSRSSV